MDRSNLSHYNLDARNNLTACQLDVNPFAQKRLAASRSTASDASQSGELNSKKQQVSDQIEAMQKTFQEFCDALNRLSDRAVQLQRQNNHCYDLLSTFEDFLMSLEDETDSAVDCRYWYLGVELLEEKLDDFDEDNELLIERLNEKMEHLYDQFNEVKQQLTSPQTIASLDRLSDQLNQVSDQIAIADLELDHLNDHFDLEVQEQRELAWLFVSMLAYIVEQVQNCLNDQQIDEFDSFTGRHFLQEFTGTLNQIQII